MAYISSLLDTTSLRDLILVTAALSFLSYRLWEWRVRKKEDDAFAARMGCEPLPKLETRWPLGVDLLVQAGRHEKAQTILRFFLQVIETAGKTHEQRLLGQKAFNTVEPKNVEAILSTQFEDFGFGKRTQNFAPLLGSSIFTQDGEPWKHSRALLRPQLAANREQNYEVIKDSVEELIQNIRNDTVVDLQPLFFQLSLNTTLFLIFGSTMGLSENGRDLSKDTEFAEAFLVAQNYLSNRGRLGNYYWLLGPPRFYRVCKITHDFIEQGIRGALKEPSSSPEDTAESGEKRSRSFIQTLLRKTRNEKVIRDQCVSLLLAGRDTTACSLSWVLRLLVRHPQVLEKLRIEVEETIGLGENAQYPTRAILKRMSYLDAVIKEVLRLYPIAPVNGRTAVRTTTLPVGGGPDGQSPFLLRKGDVVGYFVYAMHRRKDLYGEDALEFRPERWEDGTLFRKIGWGYIPFNGGPRICLGQEYALLMLGYTVTRLIQKFPRMSLPEDEPNEETGHEKQALTLVLAPGDGCRVHMRS